MRKRSNRADRLRSILLKKLSVCVLSDPKQIVTNAYGLHLPIRSASTITIPRKLNQKGGGAGHDSDFLLTNDDGGLRPAAAFLVLAALASQPDQLSEMDGL